jgi:diketogulonate reductase-like aldo/keto reductase
MTREKEIEERIEYVKATMAIAGFELTEENIEDLRKIGKGEKTADDIVREVTDKYCKTSVDTSVSDVLQ